MRNKLVGGLSLGLCLFLSSCSLLRSDTTTYDQVKVRDVSFKARKYDSLKKRILVLPFVDPVKERGQKAADTARSFIVDRLRRSGRYVILEPAVFPEKIQELVKGTREIDLEAVSRAVSSFGVSAVVAGRIMKVEASHVGDAVGVFREIDTETKALVRVRVISGQSGHIMTEGMREGSVKSSTTRVVQYADTDRQIASSLAVVDLAVEEAFKETVPSIFKALSKLRWQGRVAKVVGERIFINSGRLSGVQIGDILKVTEDGQNIYDPESKEQIGVGPGRMKGTIEVQNYFGKDGSIAVIHSGAGFQSNDKLELY